jgi:2-dehydropantoate 2-reductase
MSIKSVGVIGVGGVGGYFGGKLCQLLKDHSDLKVSFVARGEHLRAIRESGLLLSSDSDGELVCRPSVATDDFRQLPSIDVCLICVKQFDLPSVLARLAPIVQERTVIMPLLNGVDVYSRIRTVLHHGIVLPACVYVGTHIESPGKVVQRGGACRILFGPDPQRPDAEPAEVLKLFDQARIKAQWTQSIETEIWSKFIFICAYGLVSAAQGKALGEIVEDTSLRDQVRRIMTEAASLAMRSGVNLPESIVEESLAKARTFPHGARTSFQRDFENPAARDERDLFAGAMIRMAKQLGVEVPETREVASVLEKRKPPSIAVRCSENNR